MQLLFLIEPIGGRPFLHVRRRVKYYDRGSLCGSNTARVVDSIAEFMYRREREKKTHPCLLGFGGRVKEAGIDPGVTNIFHHFRDL